MVNLNPPPHPNPRVVTIKERWMTIPKLWVDTYKLSTDKLKEIPKAEATRLLKGLNKDYAGKSVAEMREIIMEAAMEPLAHPDFGGVYSNDGGVTWEEYVQVDDESTPGAFLDDTDNTWWVINPWSPPDPITSVEQTPAVTTPTITSTPFVWDKQHEQYRSVEALEANPTKEVRRTVYIRCMYHKSHFTKVRPVDKLDQKVMNIQAADETDPTKIKNLVAAALGGVDHDVLVKNIFGKYVYLVADAFVALGWNVVTGL